MTPSIRYPHPSCIRYRNNKDEYHREDGPAAIYMNGHVEWWVNGVRYRKDGLPYIVTREGIRMWDMSYKKN